MNQEEAILSAREMLVDELNRVSAPSDGKLEFSDDLFPCVRYFGSMTTEGVTTHIMLLDESPPFLLWAFQAGDDGILQVAWVADGAIQVSDDEIH